jgi:hypothetical protein
MTALSQVALPLYPASGQQYAPIQENPDTPAEDVHDTHKKKKSVQPRGRTDFTTTLPGSQGTPKPHYWT